MMPRIFIFLAVSTAFCQNYSLAQTVCEYHVSPSLPTSFQVEEEISRNGDVSPDGSFMTCYPDYMQCMALWTFDPDDHNVTKILLKGCWKGNGDCERDDCIAHDNINSRFLNNSRFCCCSSPRCNANVTYVWVPKNYTSLLGFPIIPPKLINNPYAAVVGISVFFLLLLVIAIVAICIFHSRIRGRRSLANEKLLLAEGGADREHLLKRSDALPQPKLFLDTDQIELLEIIGRGRYSTVWKSVYKTSGEHVAVKIYSPAFRQYFYNESEIYSWTNMDHENIVRFYGGAELPAATLVGGDASNYVSPANQALMSPLMYPQTCPQYWIITAYMPQGTLQDFLKANTVDWEEMCKMGASIACGLSYLHGVMAIGGNIKPAIVHRDINSRNVLVKPDGTCVLCDFGFALALEEPKPGSTKSTDDVSLTEVGTIRYFAPEILEGAVNLRDPATALKQVDVYAFGLVLWEIISRCAPIYRCTMADTDHPVPEYQAPFAKEISPHPTLEQMQLWVCKKKVRPLFSKSFYQFDFGALRILRVLVEDCWDSDSDARITASCAHERLATLQALATACGGNKDADGVLNGKPPHQGANDLVSPYARYVSYQELRKPFVGDSTVDTAATGATSGLGSLCLNSSDRARSVNSSSLGYHTTALDLPATLQPYQGRNPCMERNLLAESSDDSSNAKERVTESQFQKIDPCSPDTIVHFASPALLALATRSYDGTTDGSDARLAQTRQHDFATGGGVPGVGDLRMSTGDRGNALAMLLMRSEKNRNTRDATNNGPHQLESQFLKPDDTGEEQQQQQSAAMLSRAIELDFRGSVSNASSDSGNCTTTGTGGGNNSTSGSPRFRSSEGKMDHRVAI